MPQKIAGTFAGSASTNTAGQISDVLVIPSGTTAVFVTVSGDVDANNQVRVRRSINNGQTWSNALTINAPTTNQSIAVSLATQTHWMIDSNTSQVGKNIQYSLSAES